MIIDKLKKIKDQANKATNGPWIVDGMDAGHSKVDMHWWIANKDTAA